MVPPVKVTPLQDRIRGAIWGQFVGDAAALGAHWIYDLDELSARYPAGIEGFEEPANGHYHEGKRSGDQTHYGDAGLLLLDSVAGSGRFDEIYFGTAFAHFFGSPACRSYKDHATRETLANLAAKPGDFQNGAVDDQLATASRLAPVVAAHLGDGDAAFFDAIARCTRFAQNHGVALAVNHAHGALLRRLIRGEPFAAAFESTRTSAEIDCDTSDFFEAGATMQKVDVTAATSHFGQSCSLAEAFPSALHCALKHQDDFKAAILDTVRAGGDSAGRAAMIGAWLGAALGVEAIPQQWRDRLRRRAKIEAAVESIIATVVPPQDESPVLATTEEEKELLGGADTTPRGEIEPEHSAGNPGVASETPSSGQGVETNAFAAFFRRLSRKGNNYRLTRFVILRFVGLVYLVGFLVAANQIIPLIGHDGLLPADSFLGRLEAHFGSRSEGFWQMPSIFWFNHSDAFIQGVMWVGAGLSLIVLCGYANVIIMFVLWALYMSLIHIGQLWYSYGWETQLLETGFLAMFLCPLLDPRPFPARAPHVLVIWLFRWMIFRIMLGAGLIKIRGDECWRDLTALYYHYETQPVPNPLSRVLHFMPQWFHKGGVLWNHVVELIVPWFGFGPRIARHIAGVLMISFMVILVFSGNLSFLNWLTIIPALACLDDTFWRRVLPRFIVDRADASARVNIPRSEFQNIAVLTFAIIVAFLSLKGPIPNLLSSRQAMNTSFDRLHLVNTYGAFGTIGRERYEIIFEGTDETVPEELADWRPYEFKVKPGDISRRPAVITPYHYRLDWQIWFAAMATPNEYPWTIHFVWKLLHNDPGTLSLLANDPFPEAPPRFVRAVLYRYTYAPLGNNEGNWWQRQRMPGFWIRAVSKEDRNLRLMMESAGWLRE
jgi:ADP-ribosylglycohydrolase